MPGDQRPNIVVVVMDCVRAQNMQVYGYGRPTTPGIAELAAHGVRFDNAIVTDNHTLGSTGSLFTGMYPTRHVLSGSGANLDGGLTTLAEALGRAGYATHCISCDNPYVSSLTGLDRGFDRHVDAVPTARRWVEHVRRRAPGLLSGRRPTEAPALVEPGVRASEATACNKSLSRKERWRRAATRHMRSLLSRYVDSGAAFAFREARRVLSRSKPSKPLFVYVHLMETHTCYEPPGKHKELFLPDRQGRDIHRVNQDPLSYLTGKARMDRLDFEIIEGLYNGALHYTDAVFTRFFRQLRDDGRLKNTIVVLTADHGECFGEHAQLGHGRCPYDVGLRVPLLVWGPFVEPRQRGATVQHVVQNVDLTASCLDWAGCTNDPLREQMEGHPLPLGPTDEPRREYAVSEIIPFLQPEGVRTLNQAGVPERASLSVRSSEHKLIWNTTGEEEFYHVACDSDEVSNLIEVDSEELRKHRSALEPRIPAFRSLFDKWCERSQRDEPSDMDSEVAERLRALGYIA